MCKGKKSFILNAHSQEFECQMNISGLWNFKIVSVLCLQKHYYFAIEENFISFVPSGWELLLVTSTLNRIWFP